MNNISFNFAMQIYHYMVRGDKSPLFSLSDFLKVIEKIKSYVDELIQSDEDLFLVDVVLKGNQGNQKLIVLVDGDNGIDIDKCAEISRKLGVYIEEEDLLEGKYFLEVSSPGLDMPIKLHRQYKKNSGRQLKIELSSGEKVIGELLAVNDDFITLADKKANKEINIDYKDISRTFVEVSFK